MFLVRKFCRYEYLLLILPNLIFSTPPSFFRFPLYTTSLTDVFPTSSFTDYSCLQYISAKYFSFVFPSESFSIRLFLSSWSFRLHCSLLLSRYSPNSFNIFFLRNIFPAMNFDFSSPSISHYDYLLLL